MICWVQVTPSFKKHLTDLSEKVVASGADFGIAVDPDVDRLVFFDENGKILGEEYTQVFCSDFVLSINNGDTVSTLSSSNALKDLTKSYGSKYYFTPVGEMNVVKKMKEVNSVVGGEGGGGIIYPELHYGRDALVGVALFLGLLVKKECKISDLKNDYPEYFMKKLKVLLKDDKIIDYFNELDAILNNSNHSLIAIGKKPMELINEDFTSKISLYPTISKLLKEI